MRDPISEEANIDRLLSHFQQQGQNERIRDWRQRIEDKEARSARRPPRLIKFEEAITAFRAGLLTETQYSESAQNLIRELIRPEHPKITYVELWRAAVTRPVNPSPEIKSYLAKMDQRQKNQEQWNVELSEEQRLQLDRFCSNAEEYERCVSEAQNEDERRAWEELVSVYREALSTLKNEVWEKWADAHPDLMELLIDQLLGKRTVVRMVKPLVPQEDYYKGRLFYMTANLILKRYGLREEIAKTVTEDLIRKLRLSKAGNWQDVVGARVTGSADVSDETYSQAGNVAETKDESFKSDECSARHLAYHVQAGRAYMNVYQHVLRHGVDAVQCLDAYLLKSAQNLIAKGESGWDDRTVPFESNDEVTDDPDDTKSGDAEDSVYARSKHRQSQEAARTQSVFTGIWFSELRRVLNPRQIEILALLEEKRTHKEIGQKLQLSSKTIQRELHAIALSIRQAGLHQF